MDTFFRTAFAERMKNLLDGADQTYSTKLNAFFERLVHFLNNYYTRVYARKVFKREFLKNLVLNVGMGCLNFYSDVLSDDDCEDNGMNNIDTPDNFIDEYFEDRDNREKLIIYCNGLYQGLDGFGNAPGYNQ